MPRVVRHIHHFPRVARRRLLAAAALFALPALAQSLRRPWPKQQPTPSLALRRYVGDAEHAVERAAEGPDWRLADARGRPVLLNFWASWCEPCRNEMPALELFAEAMKDSGLVVVAINHRETDAAIARFVRTMSFDLPILRDVDGAASRAFGVRAFPTSVLIGRDGRAKISLIGEVDWTAPDVRRSLAPLF